MRSNIVVLCLVFLSLLSCDSKSVFDEYQTVPDVWNMNKIISFNVKIPDSTNAYNLFVNLRNTNDYKYSNLFLIIEMNYPHGKTEIDTLEYKMTEPDGKFLGTGFTNIKENKLWYKKAMVFNENGAYTVNIQHAMRINGDVNGIENLEGITDIGFRVEKTK